MATASPTMDEPEIVIPDKAEWDDARWEAYHNETYDSGDENPEDRRFKDYEAVIEATEGYIVPKVDEDVILSDWRPGRVLDNTYEEVVECSKFAIEWYMDKENCKGKYEFLEVKHANMGAARGIIYRLVFTARDVATNDHVLFKAEVLAGIRENIVYVCQPAPELESYI